jgi:hypothetical protein
MRYSGTITNTKLVNGKTSRKVVVTIEIPFITSNGGAQRNYTEIHSGSCIVMQDEES